jgi:predicted transposase YbfD/YdcC
VAAPLSPLRQRHTGTPAHDHLGDILAVLDHEQFRRCFVAWVTALTGTQEGVIAIDGKTVRRSGHKRKGQAPIHMVSAFAARQRLVLGQVKMADKSNEIIAIPKLLDLLAIDGAIITIDAIGCQREIAQKVVEKQADYVLALKGNQGSLREDVELFVAEQKAAGFKDTTISQHQMVDGDRPMAAHDRRQHAGCEHQDGDVKAGRPFDPIGDFPLALDDHDAVQTRPVVMLLQPIDIMDDGDGPGLDPAMVIPRQFMHHQAYGAEPHSIGSRQRLPPPPAQDRRMGRRLPRQPDRTVGTFTRFPWRTPPAPP